GPKDKGPNAKDAPVSTLTCRDTRIDTTETSRADHVADTIERPGHRLAQPAFERLERRHPSRKNLHRPRAVNLGLCPCDRVGPVVAARSRRHDLHVTRTFAQLQDVAAPFQISAVGVEAVD